MSNNDDNDILTVSAKRIIPAPAHKIFDLLANPENHKLIDGSGSVRGVKKSTEKLGLGTKFQMNMKLGIPYFMQNTVVEFEPNKKIAWQPKAPGFLGNYIGGRIWKYELRTLDNGTEVTETWDISQEKFSGPLKSQKVRDRVKDAMEKTLANIEKIVCQS